MRRRKPLTERQVRRLVKKSFAEALMPRRLLKPSTWRLWW